MGFTSPGWTFCVGGVDYLDKVNLPEHSTVKEQVVGVHSYLCTNIKHPFRHTMRQTSHCSCGCPLGTRNLLWLNVILKACFYLVRDSLVLIPSEVTAQET